VRFRVRHVGVSVRLIMISHENLIQGLKICRLFSTDAAFTHCWKANHIKPCAHDWPAVDTEHMRNHDVPITRPETLEVISQKQYV